VSTTTKLAEVKLSYRQQQTLNKVTPEWSDLPGGIGCTNLTLCALEKRGLVETRIKPGEFHKMFSTWQWRRPQASGGEAA
jgi:hypothetical protein